MGFSKAFYNDSLKRDIKNQSLRLCQGGQDIYCCTLQNFEYSALSWIQYNVLIIFQCPEYCAMFWIFCTILNNMLCFKYSALTWMFCNNLSILYCPENCNVLSCPDCTSRLRKLTPVRNTRHCSEYLAQSSIFCGPWTLHYPKHTEKFCVLSTVLKTGTPKR